MKTTGDRIVFEDTAFLGNQDTLMTDSPKLTTISRVYVRDSYIEGDVDFVYGRATTVIERSVIRALSRGSTPTTATSPRLRPGRATRTGS